MSDIWQALRTRQAVAVIAVTVVTLAIVGGVLMTATSLGCGPANAFGIKTISSKCAKPVAAVTPGIPSPSPVSNVTPTNLASPSPSPSPSPTPEFSPSPLPSATAPDTGPATAAYPPFYPATTASNGSAIPALSLNCRLPLFAGQSGSGGFVVFPGGTFIADPSSAVALPTPPAGEPSPIPPSAGQGMGGPQPSLSYDAQFKKWVPVPLNYLSPDGSRYAFLSASSIYVEDVASGTLSEIGKGQAWTIVGVEAAGVYAMKQSLSGLWLVPFSGDPTQVTSAGFWQAVSATAAYGTPTSAVPQGAENQVLRVDLASGAVATWFARSGTQSQVVGIDTTGAVILYVNYGAPSYATEIWVVGAAGKGVPIGGNSNTYQGINLSLPPVSDANGIWFGAYSNTQGLVLYVPNKGVYWMSNLGGSLAGGCVKA